jgi:hypothetical protein
VALDVRRLRCVATAAAVATLSLESYAIAAVAPTTNVNT